MPVRGLIGAPRAMARPARRADEWQAIIAALETMPADMSARSRARCLAQRVVAETLAADRRQDPMEVALAAATAALNHDPVFRLADAASDDLAKERLRRFEARGCRQLSPEAWEAETSEIAALLETRLVRKFRGK